MPYVTQKTATWEAGPNHRAGSRTEWKMDIATFAKDLAKALGGTVGTKDTMDTDTWQKIELGRDVLTLYVSGEYNGKVQVNISIDAVGLKFEDRDRYDERHKTPRISVSPDKRSIDAIARDVRKRVIDAGQEALNLQREHANRKIEARGSLVEHAATLMKLAPVTVRPHDDKLTADVYGGTGNPYVNATLNADGKVTVTRLESMSLETFAAVYALVKAGSKK